jgi:hypothetical protein
MIHSKPNDITKLRLDIAQRIVGVNEDDVNIII